MAEGILKMTVVITRSVCQWTDVEGAIGVAGEEESAPLLQQARPLHFEQPVPQHFLAEGCDGNLSPAIPRETPCHARKIPSSNNTNEVLAILVAIYACTLAEFGSEFNRFNVSKNPTKVGPKSNDDRLNKETATKRAAPMQAAWY